MSVLADSVRGATARLDPLLQRVQAWWDASSRREQVLITVMLVLGLLVTVFYGVVEPIRAQRESARARIGNAALLERLIAGGMTGQTVRARRGTPTAILSESAGAAGLTLDKLDESDGQLSASISQAPFDRVVSWIADVERTSRLRVRQADIRRLENPGMVSASVAFVE